MKTYNHAFSMNFTVSGLSSDDSEKFTDADRELVREAVLEAACDHDCRGYTLVQKLETGWSDVIEEDS
jgi:hypothetical protein